MEKGIIRKQSKKALIYFYSHPSEYADVNTNLLFWLIKNK
jgi:hypothetical protein